MNNTLRQLTSSYHSIEDREKYDFYATEPKAVELLLKVENFSNSILEPACGNGLINHL